jgi:hypothetical protein
MIDIKKIIIEHRYADAKRTEGCYTLVKCNGTNILYRAPSSEVIRALHCMEFIMRN